MQTLTINAYNQISNPTAFTYDNAGNQTADAASAYQWYAAGNLEKAFGVTYSYDGDGNRVMKSNGKIYWRDPNGQVLDESDLSGNFTDEYVYFGGMRIAHRVVSSNSIYYYAPDALGTSRVIAGSAGTACYDSDFYPFGGEQNHLNTSGSNYKFTGQERDAESASANDYFGARYNSNILGRFLSPDPSGLSLADQSNPQSFNFYTYVKNNPIIFTDPHGLDCVFLDARGGTSIVNGPDAASIDHDSNQGDCNQAGGYWANGTVSSLSDVQTFSNNDNALIISSVSGITDVTLANQGESQGDFGLGDFPTSFLSGNFWDPSQDSPNDYLVAIHDKLSEFPEVCSITVSARAGSGPESAGLSWNSRGGINFVTRLNLAQVGAANLGISTSGSRGSYTVSIPIPETPFSVGASTRDMKTVSSINAGVNLGFVNAQVAGNLGQRYGCGPQ